MKILCLAAAAAMTIGAGGAFAAPKNSGSDQPAPPTQFQGVSGSETVSSEPALDRSAMLRAYQQGLRNTELSSAVAGD